MKSLYKTHVQPYLEEIKKMFLNGENDKTIMKKLNIGRDAFYNYKKKHSEFAECFEIKNTFLVEDAKISLFKLVNGYECIEKKEKITENSFGTTTKEIEIFKRKYPPNFNAIKFVLLNKDKTNWRNETNIKYDEDFEDIEDDFYELDNIKLVEHFLNWFNVEYQKNLFNILKGGRASGKSTSIARRLVKDILMYQTNILVIRKVHSTILESCYEELKQAINDMGVADEFKFVAGNDPKIIRKKTKQRFIFRGGQEPEKIKSIKTSKFPITRLWIEELTEFKNYDEVKIIIDSVIRAELKNNLDYKIIFSYNPAKRKTHWCNKKYNVFESPKNTFIDHSTSFDNNFLSNDFIEEAKNIKENNINLYKWNYLGEAIGGGITPFSNLEFINITDDEIEYFDNILQGIDWGFAVDPVCFLRMHYDKTRMILYIFDEIYGQKISNYNLAKMIKEKCYNDYRIIADSSEPKSVNDLVVDGINCVGARKGPGSIEHGLEWLDSLNKIVIDFKRCPNAAREFENIDYKIDKDGNVISKLEDKDDHCLHGDTIINTINGNYKIKDLVNKTGEIHCFDEQNNKHTISKFYNVRKTGRAKIYNINLKDGRKIKCSSLHPILTKEGWKFAKDLNINDYIVDISDHNYAKIESIEITDTEDVFNMEVEKYHNFSIENGLIVHNSIDCTRYAVEDYTFKRKSMFNYKK